MTITVKAPPMKFRLTPRIVAAVAHEEGLVLEAYKDSVGVWTWSIGVTSASGHNVMQYKDKPSTIEAAVAASIDVMRKRYLPAVQQAFEGHRLKDNEIAGALSFHWNTGAIARASWVKFWKAGLMDSARASYLSWQKPPEIIARRKRDAALFFDGVWPEPTVPVYSVRKPSYTPGKATRMDLLPVIEQIMGGV